MHRQDAAARCTGYNITAQIVLPQKFLCLLGWDAQSDAGGMMSATWKAYQLELLYNTVLSAEHLQLTQLLHLSVHTSYIKPAVIASGGKLARKCTH